MEKAGQIADIDINEDLLLCDKDKVNTYTAALIADFIRYRMIEEQIGFSFETVMSHSGKIDFLKAAKKKEYKTYLYFIATDDPEININRVQNRIKKGGHPVPKQKIIDRYYRSLELLSQAVKIADHAYILDNSEEQSSVLFEKKNDGKGYLQIENYPDWFDKSVMQKSGIKGR